MVESGPGGQDLAASTWQRLETLPDPRSSQGRIYPLACLVAIAVCAFTAAGNDRSDLAVSMSGSRSPGVARPMGGRGRLDRDGLLEQADTRAGMPRVTRVSRRP